MTGATALWQSAAASIAVASLLMSGASPSAKPLKQALAELMLSHPRILSSERGVKAAGEGERAADSRFLPTLSLSGDSGLERIDSLTRRTSQGEAYKDRRDSVTLSLTQNLFDGFESTSGSRIADLETKVADAALERTRQEVLLEGIVAYLSVLRETELLQIARRNERTIESQRFLEQERFQRGSGLAVDVLQSEARLEVARERRVAINGRLEAATARYIELFNEPPAINRMAPGETPVNALPGAIEAAIDLGRQNNPVMYRSRSELSIADEERRRKRSDYFPELDFVVEGSWEDNVDGVASVRREQRVLLRGRWTLFDGFRREALDAQASERYGAQVNDHANLGRDIETRVRRAWINLKTSRRTAELLGNAAGIAEKVFEARQTLRREGRESLINVLDAEQELNSARLRRTRAEYDVRIAVFRLLFETGLLTPAILNLSR